ncbi:MAG TPA: BatD family protein, partial [Gemmatimonadales bacterium]|nr:BatD family protein [Gemmatimonadales bacterium]
FTGAVGQGIRLERTVNPATVRAGEPVNVAFTLAGEGNPALWPTPALNWPPGARAYPDRTDERVAVTGGRLGGSKTFGFTLVADSAGAIPLPGATYTYFDTGVHEFRTAALSVGVLPVAPGGDAKVARPLPPPLLANRAPPLAWRVANAIPLWLWLAAVVLPPAVFYGRRLRRQRPRRRTPATVADSHGVEAQVESLLAALLPAPEALTESGLVAALRSAGLPQADAEQLVATRERLRALRYGPFEGPVPATLAADARALVRRLAPARRRASAIWAAGIGAALLSVYGGPAAAQGAPSPEQLYGQGSLRAAAEGFARRTEEAPASAASWYNLGAAYYRLGHDGRAAAAWQQALRLAPRNRSVLRALALVPPPESGSAARLWMPPFAWYELALAAVPLWIVGWALISGRGRRRDLGIGTIALAAILGASALALHHRIARPLAIAAEKQPLQLSPHERAPTIAPLDAGAALFVRRRTPAWLMVEAPGGRLGWVQSASVVPLRGP